MSNPIVDPLVEVVDTSPTSDLVRIEATLEGAVTVVLDRPERHARSGKRWRAIRSSSSFRVIASPLR